MPYVERVTKAGNTIEIERYFTSRYKKKGISRGDKVKPTKEEQEKVNTRQAERKLRILINANYGYGDYHLVLDYIRRKGQPDRTPEQMRQDIDVFLRECRKEYRKAGLDNGSEFADAEGLQRSIINEGEKRTKVYYCHPYSSWERGTNEVTNKMIRRKIPKGTNFDDRTEEEVESIENWINGYPRKIHGYHSAGELFEEEVKQLA